MCIVRFMIKSLVIEGSETSSVGISDDVHASSRDLAPPSQRMVNLHFATASAAWRKLSCYTTTRFSVSIVSIYLYYINRNGYGVLHKGQLPQGRHFNLL